MDAVQYKTAPARGTLQRRLRPAHLQVTFPTEYVSVAHADAAQRK